MLTLLQKNKKIIVNTDIDGVLSAFVLCKFCGCEIVGFSNSDDRVWWRKDKIGSIYDGVYIDMYVPRKDVVTIDQHIIAYDEEELHTIASFGTKINPNLENPRTFTPGESYKYKYPFGTVHYLLAILGAAGITVQFDLNRLVDLPESNRLCIGDFVLRADDAAKTTLCSNYRSNALQWWQWLEHKSAVSTNIRDLVTYLQGCSRKEEDVESRKKDIAKFFRARYGCRKSDGGFKSPCDINGFVLDATKKYMMDFWSILGANPKDLQDVLTAKYECACGKAYRCWIKPDEAQELKTSCSIGGQQVFSYGYVNSPRSPRQNFSYTVM